jgi:hypothetical protein
MMALERELERKEDRLQRDHKRLQALVRAQAAHRIADGLRQRHRVLHVERGARNEHAILRMHRIVWIGPDAYFVFSVTNDRKSFYRVAGAQLQVDGESVAEAISLPGSRAAERQELLGLVAPGARAQGVALLPRADMWKGKNVALTVQEGQTRRQSLTVTVSMP